MTLRRHDWVYLRPEAAPAFTQCEAGARDWVCAWIARGGPLVVTRQCTPEDRLALGAVVPASLGKARVACTVARDAAVRVRGPVTFTEAASALAPHDAASLARFGAAIAPHADRLGVYGSTAWEFLTGERYRHPASDLDVICDVASSAGFTGCLAAFADAARYFSSRVDGEIRFACGRAVAWRELADACRGGHDLVLAKDARAVGLMSLCHLLARLQ